MAVNNIYYSVQQGRICKENTIPVGCRPLTEIGANLLPPQITELHRSLRRWHDLNLSIGIVSPRRFWVTADDQLLIHFGGNSSPQTTTFVSNGKELAGWLLLLNHWMETFVVIARARTVWSVSELGAAIPFLSPAYLPQSLLTLTADNWQSLATALATALADGDMAGEPTNRHWQKR